MSSSRVVAETARANHKKNSMFENRPNELEFEIAHQDVLLEDLNQVICRPQEGIDRLNAAFNPVVAKDFEAKRSSRALAFFWANLRLDRTGRFLALPVVALQVKSKT